MSHFETYVRMIEADTRTTSTDKATMIFKAWSHFRTTRNMFSILVDLGRIY
jgi:hypothetical protein